jgi:hypothetical protein
MFELFGERAMYHLQLFALALAGSGGLAWF